MKEEIGFEWCSRKEGGLDEQVDAKRIVQRSEEELKTWKKKEKEKNMLIENDMSTNISSRSGNMKTQIVPMIGSIFHKYMFQWMCFYFILRVCV